MAPLFPPLGGRISKGLTQRKQPKPRKGQRKRCPRGEGTAPTRTAQREGPRKGKSEGEKGTAKGFSVFKANSWLHFTPHPRNFL